MGQDGYTSTKTTFSTTDNMPTTRSSYCFALILVNWANWGETCFDAVNQLSRHPHSTFPVHVFRLSDGIERSCLILIKLPIVCTVWTSLSPWLLKRDLILTCSSALFVSSWKHQSRRLRALSYIFSQLCLIDTGLGRSGDHTRSHGYEKTITNTRRNRPLNMTIAWARWLVRSSNITYRGANWWWCWRVWWMMSIIRNRAYVGPCTLQLPNLMHR